MRCSSCSKRLSNVMCSRTCLGDGGWEKERLGRVEFGAWPEFNHNQSTPSNVRPQDIENLVVYNHLTTLSHARNEKSDRNLNIYGASSQRSNRRAKFWREDVLEEGQRIRTRNLKDTGDDLVWIRRPQPERPPRPLQRSRYSSFPLPSRRPANCTSSRTRESTSDCSSHSLASLPGGLKPSVRKEIYQGLARRFLRKAVRLTLHIRRF
ncbi:hypothetical protein SCHPADRAFT_509746 [Schizopora paradoxa]|uniref:Uncharacterized protein n=1 Tax=Schizopora paradoxa TaxID=27342 RepID=A0A0H2RFK3_9AGAM|nr:hypothetical protein SCHPADRAFT_509746 [Schizopora paradoxa]